MSVAAANKIQIKRTAVSGRTPNTTTSANGSFIDTGELALNLTDGKMFSSNGSVFFEVGANLSNLNVTSNASISKIIANGAFGSDGQALVSNGSAMYWAAPTSSAQIFPFGDYGNLTNTNVDAFGVDLSTVFDCHASGVFTIVDLQADLQVEDGGQF